MKRVIQWSRRLFNATSRERRAGAALFIGLACFYLLTTSRERPWSDGQPVYATASAMVGRGELHPSHPLLTSLVHLPGAAFEALVGPFLRGGHARLQVFTSHLAPAILGALVCLLFFQATLFLGLSRLAARLATLMVAFATIIWVYARWPGPPIVETVAFTGFFAALLRVAKLPNARACTALGLWFTALIAARPTFFVIVPGVALFLLGHVRRTGMSPHWLWRRALPGLGGALLLASLDAYLRLGSATAWLTAIVAGPFGQDLLLGLWGIVLAPGKSMFLYSPPLLLSLFGFRALAARGLGWVGWALLATVAPFALYLAHAADWLGEAAWWGPRHLIFATPALLLPAAVLLDECLNARRWLPLVMVAVLAVVGARVQALGNGLRWDTFTRFTKAAYTHWLGVPERGAAFFPLREGGCEPCFEDSHINAWLPPFDPIEGHAWMLGHVLRGHDWVQAEQDVSWHRYTVLVLPLGNEYQRARVDWWFLNFYPRALGKGVFYLLLLMAATAFGLLIWWREAGDGQGGFERP